MSDRHPFIYNEFDIEAARKAGKSFERERIIKLLEALTETRPIETNTNYWGYSFERVIALIKGEK